MAKPVCTPYNGETSDAYVYSAELYCEDCARKIMARLDAEGKAPVDPSDESSFDSDDYPKGPCENGGGEADTAQFCAGCHIPLGNPLTDNGVENVIVAMEEEAADLTEANRIMPAKGTGEDTPEFAYWHGYPHKAIVLAMADSAQLDPRRIDLRRRYKFARYALENGDSCEATFNRFTLTLPLECVRDCSAQGDCDESASYWARKLTVPADVSADAIRTELAEYGAWDAEELADDTENWKRLIWCAACNVAEEM